MIILHPVESITTKILLGVANHNER